MTFIRALGISCLLGAVAASPVPDALAARDLTTIEQYITTTVTVYVPVPVAPTADISNSTVAGSLTSTLSSINPGGPNVPAYPFPNATSAISIGTGSAVATGAFSTGSSAVYLSTGTAPAYTSRRVNSTATGPLSTAPLGTAPLRTGTGASTGTIPPPSGGPIPPYRNLTSASVVTTAVTTLSSLNSTAVPTTFNTTTVSAGTSAIPTTTPSSTPITTTPPSAITPTPTPAPTTSESLAEEIVDAVEEIEEVIAEVLEDVFPAVTGLPGWSEENFTHGKAKAAH